MSIPLLRHVMVRKPQVVGAETTIKDAEQLMKQLEVSHLPVMINGVVESVVSVSDIRRFTLPTDKANDQQYLVRDICPLHVYFADSNDPLDRVLTTMADKHVSSVLALEEGELAGIFTTNDACRLFAKNLTARQ